MELEELNGFRLTAKEVAKAIKFRKSMVFLGKLFIGWFSH